MAFPMPKNAWGRRRWRKRAPDGPLSLEVPVASPQRQLHALRVTVKPHDWTREAIQHRLAVDSHVGAEQTWHPEWADSLASAAQGAAERLRIGLSLESGSAAADPDGIHMAVRFAPGTPLAAARAVAVVCSSRLPDTWFRLEPLALLGGRFYRRERGYRLHLRPAGDIHIPREMRALVRDLLAPAKHLRRGRAVSSRDERTDTD